MVNQLIEAVNVEIKNITINYFINTLIQVTKYKWINILVFKT